MRVCVRHVDVHVSGHLLAGSRARALPQLASRALSSGSLQREQQSVAGLIRGDLVRMSHVLLKVSFQHLEARVQNTASGRRHSMLPRRALFPKQLKKLLCVPPSHILLCLPACPCVCVHSTGLQ